MPFKIKLPPNLPAERRAERTILATIGINPRSGTTLPPADVAAWLASVPASAQRHGGRHG